MEISFQASPNFQEAPLASGDINLPASWSTSVESSFISFLDQILREEPISSTFSWQPQAHNIILHRYEFLEELGQGGMGVVWKSYDHILKRDVAIKILHNKKLNKNSFQIRQNLQEEAAKLAQIKHDLVVNVYDYVIYQGVPFIVQEYLEGWTLKQYLSEPHHYRNINFKHAFLWLTQTLEAVHHLHQKKLIHRDITPKNIFILKYSHQIKILDLGLALFESDMERPQEDSHTIALQAGTRRYWAPEQEKGDPQDARTDIYGIGTTFQELFAIFSKNKSIQSLHHYYFLFLIQRTLLTATQKNPSLRYQTVSAWSRQLRNIKIIFYLFQGLIFLGLLMILIAIMSWAYDFQHSNTPISNFQSTLIVSSEPKRSHFYQKNTILPHTLYHMHKKYIIQSFPSHAQIKKIGAQGEPMHTPLAVIVSPGEIFTFEIRAVHHRPHRLELSWDEPNNISMIYLTEDLRVLE